MTESVRAFRARHKNGQFSNLGFRFGVTLEMFLLILTVLYRDYSTLVVIPIKELLV